MPTRTADATRAIAAGGAPRRRRMTGVLLMLVGGVSNQAGAGIGATAFAGMSPAGVVAIRQVVAAAVLLPVARPPLRRMRWSQWWPVLLLALVFSCMNLALYTAIDRIGLGLAVTLEFLGPLVIALAASRTRRDLVAAVAAGVGVYLLVLPGPSSDYIGVGLALLAAACWAAYIVLNRLVGARLPGVQGPAVATAVSAVLYLPVLILLAVTGRLTGPPLLAAIATGLLCSVVPYAADLSALRHVPTRFFGVFMSLHPVLAAVSGMIILQQTLSVHQWLGIGIIAAANAVAVISTRSATDTSAARHGDVVGAPRQSLRTQTGDRTG